MKKRFWKTALLLVIALLILGGVWYARPVGVETLFPGLEPDQISVTVLDFDGSKQVDRSLTLLKGTPEFDELWGEVQALRFRRAPTSVLVQALPFLAGTSSSQSKTLEEDDIGHLYLDFFQGNDPSTAWVGELSFRIDSWAYQDLDHGVTLPLRMKDSQAIGQEMAHAFWERAE